MSLALESDIYQPSIDDHGIYVDILPKKFIYGVRCPCGSRKDHVYDNRSSFAQHVKTTTHKKWIDSLNANKDNFIVENTKLADCINNQKLVIAQLQREIDDQKSEIRRLSQELEAIKTVVEFRHQPHHTIDGFVEDLIDFT